MMRVSRVRFTLRQMMLGVALAGFVLGAAVEVPRVYRRWRFCRERADLLTDFAAANRRYWQAETTHVARVEVALRWLQDLGPQPRSVAALTGPCGDPERDRLLLRWIRSYIRQHGMDRGHPATEGELLISPEDLVGYSAHLLGALRESVGDRARWSDLYAQQARDYRRAAARFWEPLPRKIINL